MSTLLRLCQVYLVTGGQNHRSGAQFYHSSTETLAKGASGGEGAATLHKDGTQRCHRLGWRPLGQEL